MSSGGFGGLNKSPNGIVLGCVQLQLPVVKTKDDLAKQTSRIVEMVGKARRNLGTMDLVIFPEYSLHGLSMDTNPEIMCRLDGPEVQAFKAACVEHKIWGCFSIMEYNPDGNPYNTGLVIDDTGKIVLYYRKLHPDPGGAVGARQRGHTRVQWTEGCKLAPSSATMACSPRWPANARTRAPRS